MNASQSKWFSDQNGYNGNSVLIQQFFLTDGYNNCLSIVNDKSFWLSYGRPCDEGFVADEMAGYCYRSLPENWNFLAGQLECQANFFSEMTSFDQNVEVNDFMTLLQTGDELFFVSQAILCVTSYFLCHKLFFVSQAIFGYAAYDQSKLIYPHHELKLVLSHIGNHFSKILTDRTLSPLD